MSFRRVLPRAELDAGDPKLLRVLETAFSKLPANVEPIRSVTKVQMKKRGEMVGLVGLTRYCCVRPGGEQNPDGPPSQTITFYSDLFDEISDRSAVGVMAHELAHAWLNEHASPDESQKREKEADELARRWGYGRYLDALSAETEPV